MTDRRPGWRIGLLCLAFLVTSVRADDHERIRELVEAGRILPLEQILERARQRLPGRVLETELETRQGRHVYEIEILDRNGRVRELLFDARTGAFLAEERED